MVFRICGVLSPAANPGSPSPEREAPTGDASDGTDKMKRHHRPLDGIPVEEGKLEMALTACVPRSMLCVGPVATARTRSYGYRTSRRAHTPHAVKTRAAYNARAADQHSSFLDHRSSVRIFICCVAITSGARAQMQGGSMMQNRVHTRFAVAGAHACQGETDQRN